MAMAASTVIERQRLAVRRDLRIVRNTLKQFRRSQRLADLGPFGRRTAARTLEYVEHRSHRRMPVQMPIYVTPATFDGKYAESLEGAESEMLAVTKNVSLRGIGFTHDEPLESDYAIITFDLLEDKSVSLLLHVRWSQPEWGYSYMSGGTFVGIIETTGW